MRIRTKFKSVAVRAVGFVMMIAMSACDRSPKSVGDGRPPASPAMTQEPAAPTNRVDIPGPVRQNLGITFAPVETRNVARTLRVPGRFELLPTARRQYRAPVGGRVEVLVEQFQPVRVGTPLYRVDSPAWRDLREQIAAITARVESMGPLRQAHAKHEAALADKVQLWKSRLEQLEQIRAAGGGSAAQFTEARATLIQTQAELADLQEKDTELEAQQKQLEAELRAHRARRSALIRASGCVDHLEADSGGEFTVCAVAPGVIESIDVTPGGLAEQHAQVVAVVQPDQLRIRARALQSDLGQLAGELEASITPPRVGFSEADQAVGGTVRIGLQADADQRTLDLFVTPQRVPAWAREGVLTSVEVTLPGGQKELAIPLAAVVRDGTKAIIFRRDPRDPDKVIRLEADLGIDDGRWIVINSGVAEGDQIVVGGNFQLMLATSGAAAKGGHFHPDGTYHEGGH